MLLAAWITAGYSARAASRERPQAPEAELRANPPKPAPKSPAALDGLAKSLIARGDYAAAIKLLRTAPRDEALTVDLADAYDKSGDSGEASKILLRGLRATPASARLTGALVVFLASHGQLEDAYRLAERFAKLHPAQVDAQKIYLRVLVATNDSTAARPLARKLLSASPRDGELLYLTGLLERKAGEFAAARDHLRESIAIAPDFADSRYNLGISLARLQDFAGAREQLEKAIALGSPEPEAHLELSKALRAQGETAQADEQLSLYQNQIKQNADRAMAADKSDEAARAIAMGKADQAVALYRDAVQAEPEDASLRLKLALALDSAGDTVGERAALNEAIRIDPNSAPALVQLGYLEYHNGDYDLAEGHIRQALHADAGLTQAWISLAAILATKSNFAAAQEAVGHALQLDPHNSQALLMKKELGAQLGPGRRE